MAIFHAVARCERLCTAYARRWYFPRRWIRWLTALALLFPTTAWAQAGWYYLPSVTLSETFDDNINARTVTPMADWISRLTTALKVGYRSTPLTLLATSSLNAEAFAIHPEFSGLNQKSFGLEFQGVPARPLTLRFNGLFTQTQTPSDITQSLGLALELERNPTTQLSLAPSLTYRFDLRTSGDVSYGFTQTESRGVETTGHFFTAALSRALTHVDTGTVTYGVRLTESDGSDSRSNFLTLGWEHRLSPTTAFSIVAGPRVTDGEFGGVEVNARLTHRWRVVAVALGYARSEAVIPGEAGQAEIQTFTASVRFTPLRSFTITLGPTVSEAKLSEGTTLSESIDASATYRVARYFTLFARYRFSHSDTDGAMIDRNIISIGVEVSRPTRLD